MGLKSKVWAITGTSHPDCERCNALAQDAVAISRVTGAVQHAQERDSHGVVVRRVLGTVTVGPAGIYHTLIGVTP